jgi:hypothetical protein
MPSPLDQPEQPTPAEQNDNEVQDQTAIDQPPQPLAIEYGEATQTAADASTSDETVQKLDLGQGGCGQARCFRTYDHQHRWGE